MIDAAARASRSRASVAIARAGRFAFANTFDIIRWRRRKNAAAPDDWLRPAPPRGT
ncbi:hypothetical protein KTF37_16895 [Burkholderia multivorans]|uniref:hypothetical protein n=1 Tax=Burkholderia multivorans TaxID=87883 RepID=UPI001C223E2F|nr:hypothetical protein [Burkholderia multivorans]MBU9678533.1 hypothetical protein [Burkholderia multivorans]